MPVPTRFRRSFLVSLLILLVTGLALFSTVRAAVHAHNATGKPSTHSMVSSASNAVTCGTGTWNLVPAASTGSNNDNLSAVAVGSSSDVWAVGYYASSGYNQALAENWNGTSWSVVPTADVGQFTNIFSGVAVVPSTTHAWAVGGYYPNNGAEQTLIERWNGTNWIVVPSPNVGTGNNYLSGVTAVTAHDVWAAGSYVDATSGFNQTLLEHWNGTSWSVVTDPNPGSASNVLRAISAHAANKIWAVGYFTNSSTGNDHSLTERMLSGSWSITPSPNGDPGNTILNGVEAVPGLDQMWAVGSDYRNGQQHTLIEHWNGRTWGILPSPSPAASAITLTGVATVSLNSNWAVGYYTDPNSGFNQTLIEHWDGTSWSIAPSPNSGSFNNQLDGTARVPGSNHIWAVGTYDDGSGDHFALTELYC